MGKKFISNKEPVRSELTPGDVWESEKNSKIPFRKVWTGEGMGWSEGATSPRAPDDEVQDENLEEIEDFKAAGTEADAEDDEEEDSEEDDSTEGDEDDGSDETEVPDSDGEEGTGGSASDDPKLPEGRKGKSKKSAKKKSRR